MRKTVARPMPCPSVRSSSWMSSAENGSLRRQTACTTRRRGSVRRKPESSIRSIIRDALFAAMSPLSRVHRSLSVRREVEAPRLVVHESAEFPDSALELACTRVLASIVMSPLKEHADS